MKTWLKQHPVTVWFLACVLITAIGWSASTPLNGRVRIPAPAGSGLIVGSNWGTPIKGIKVGKLVFPNAATTTAGLTTSGTLPSSIPIVSPLSTLGSAAKFHAVCTTDTLIITTNADPGTTVTFGFTIYQP